MIEQSTFRIRQDDPRPPSTLSHYVLKTSQLPEMRAWYLTVLCARPVYENENAVFMTFDDESHRLAIVNVPGLTPRPRFGTGLDHAAFTYDDLGVLLGTYRRLKGEGIEPRWCVNHRVTTSFYYEDPDANRVELQYENYRTTEELFGVLSKTTVAKREQAFFDPEDLITRYESGQPIDAFRDLIGPGQSTVAMLRSMDLIR